MPNARKADWLLLAALLTAATAIALLVTLAAPPQRAGGLPRQRSTFFNTASGLKAAYLSLERLDFHVDRLRRSIDEDTLAGADALALLEPLTPLADYEAERLLDWVRDGGRLLLAPSGRLALDLENDDEDAIPLADWFAWTKTPTSFCGLDENSDVAKFIRVDAAANAELLDGIAELTVAGDARLDEHVVNANGPLADCTAAPVWGDDAGLIAARLACGEGEIIVLADAHALCNRGLREADNALWLANLARRLAGAGDAGALLFDEYHAGFPYQEPSWSAIVRLMLAEGWGPSVAQAALVALLALIAGGARFGRPRGLEPGRRRRHGEFLAAAGRLLHAGRATELAAETLRPYYQNRLCRALGLPNGVSEATLRAALSARGRALPLDALTPESARRLNAGKLLAACRHLEQELERLEHAK